MPIADIPATRALWSQRAGRANSYDDPAGLRAAFSSDGGSAVRTGFARLDGSVPAAGFAHANPGAISRGWQLPSGSGRADGNPVGEARRTERFGGPRFDLPVPHGGYSWWYLDALSDDGHYGITIIAFIGSVFSPYYAAHRHRVGAEWADPLAHCLAPCARVDVDLKRPGLTWSGSGYLDMNSGSAPLERDFVDWSWSRAALKSGTAILYDVTRRNGRDLAVAIKVDPSGRVENVDLPPRAVLPSTLWQVARETRADANKGAKITATFEDGPFYSRSLLSTHILGERVPAVHESLSLDRFKAPWVQFLLPFKMPRRAGW